MSPSISRPSVARSVSERRAIGADDDPYRMPCEARSPRAATVRFERDAADAYWLAHVKLEFRLRSRPGGWAYAGDCPRCCHPAVPATVMADKRLGLEVEVTITCGCARRHPGGSSQQRGCGRSGPVVFRMPWMADAWPT